MARLFVALWPPAHVVAVLESLERPERPGLRWTRPEQWHVTLRFLGEADPEEVTGALEGACKAPARAVMGPATARLGRTVLMAPVVGVDDLAAVVWERTAHLGRPPEHDGFTGHITVARARQPKALRGLSGEACGAKWPVTEVALVESRLHPDGARYETVAAFATDG